MAESLRRRGRDGDRDVPKKRVFAHHGEHAVRATPAQLEVENQEIGLEFIEKP